MNESELGRNYSGLGESRRDFLRKTGLAAGGLAAVPAFAAADDHNGAAKVKTAHDVPKTQGADSSAPAFNFQGVTMPQRKSFYDYTAADVNRLANAYKNLKALDQSDPRAWLNQAKIHAAHCGGSEMEVHQSWWFPAWHRCYLFFYERILAKLSDDPGAFALPYWDWANQQEVPNTGYNQGSVSPFFDESLSLYDQNRYAAPGVTFTSDPYNTNVAAYTSGGFLAQLLSNDANEFTSFCGSDPSVAYQAGDLEGYPHNTVHAWTGGNAPDMGDLTSAARDLLFFLHHANVDRMFTLWLTQGSPLDAPGSPLKGGPWYTQRFNFWDENGNPVSVSVQNAITNMAGNYLPPSQGFTLVNTPQQLKLTGQAQSIATNELPRDLRNRMVPPGGAQPAKPAPQVRLKIEGVEVAHDVPVTLHVFLNKTDATVKDINGPNFVGTINLLPASASKGMTHKPFNITIDVTSKAHLFGMDGAGKGPTVTIVPVQPHLKAGEPAPTLRFKSISVITKH